MYVKQLKMTVITNVMVDDHSTPSGTKIAIDITDFAHFRNLVYKLLLAKTFDF